MSARDTQVGGNHYKDLKIQPAEYCHANNIPFIDGCIIKYATRWKQKGGIQDLKKIIHFAQLLIELEEKAQKDTPDPHPTIKSTAKVWGLPLPVGTDPEAIRDLREYIKYPRTITDKADKLIQKQAKLVRELHSGESLVNIVAPTYDMARNLAMDKKWPNWVYYPASNTLHGLRERVFVVYLNALQPNEVAHLAARNIVYELD